MTTPPPESTSGFERAMRRAFELAARGPATGVNPQVGCVLIDGSGRSVAEGWHRGAGTAHAEVDALSNLAQADGATRPADGGGHTGEADNGAESTRAQRDRDLSGGLPDARGLTAVVTLEPCNHTGRTGPCSEALIAAGIERVVYALADPGPASAGGAVRLAEAGVEVVGGILAAEASELIRPWLTATALQRPFVTAKWASTLDGRAAASDGSSRWITGEAARRRVHEQRAASDAILVGTGTVFVDDPSLTARDDSGELRKNQPLPIVIGERQIPGTARLWGHPRGVIESGTRNLDDVLTWLFEQGVRRVFVEGGPTLTSAFVAAGLVDEYLIYLAPKLLGGDHLAIGDVGAPAIGDAHRLDITSVEHLDDDLLVVARPKE